MSDDEFMTIKARRTSRETQCRGESIKVVYSSVIPGTAAVSRNFL